MRNGIMLAALLTIMSGSTARADEWCGYATRDNAIIECGYTSVADCESAVGKGGMCFVDPELAANSSASPQRRKIHAHDQLEAID